VDGLYPTDSVAIGGSTIGGRTVGGGGAVVVVGIGRVVVGKVVGVTKVVVVELEVFEVREAVPIDVNAEPKATPIVRTINAPRTAQTLHCRSGTTAGYARTCLSRRDVPLCAHSQFLCQRNSYSSPLTSDQKVGLKAKSPKRKFANMEDSGVRPWLEPLVDRDAQFVDSYMAIRNRVLKDGAIPAKYKILMGMVTDAINAHPDGVKELADAARATGASEPEVIEAVEVAYLYGATAALVMGVNAF
jgi:alkylhydroperoxidase/carboxymuconolactone decarboxylase family protein YurZ